MPDNSDTNYFAETNFRGRKQRFGIKRKDRQRHTYIVGKTGMGKSTLLENLTIQDIRAGHGVGIIDPHGEFAEKMLDFIPQDRIKDVVYFNPADMQFPIGFNIMEGVGDDQRHLVSAGLMGVFKKIWPDVWSARMEYILSNAVLALLEYPGSTLLGINRMLSDKDYRLKVVDYLKDDVVKAFWTQEFAKYTERFTQEATPAIQNKIGQFITNPLMRNIIGQEHSTFDVRKMMDEEKILIMNLSKGRVGEGNSHLLGAMLITKIYLAAMSRVDIPEDERKDFYLYVDEFQNFATDAFASILSEARKYRLDLSIAHQYIGQLVTDTSTKVRDAVFGNVGTMIAFRVGAADAEFLENEFAPELTIEDLVNSPFANIYLKLMIDGATSRPFSATTLPPEPKPPVSFREQVIEESRAAYSRPASEIKAEISEWITPVSAGTASADSSGKMKVDDREKFSAACGVCGKEVLVPFKPDGKRPIYCAEHLKEQQARAERGEAPLPTKKPAVAAPPSVVQAPVPVAQTPVVPSPKPRPVISTSIPKPQLSAPPRIAVPEKILQRHEPKQSIPVAPKPLVVPPRPSTGAPVVRSSAPFRDKRLPASPVGRPAIQEKEEGKYLSLKDLKPRGEARDFAGRSKSRADLEGLRAALQTLEKVAPSVLSVSKTPPPQHPVDSIPPRSNIIKPGQTIKFD
ncbi:MAG: type IV secretion system DNA-binding domain-containing protein [Candidatus Niyogibacteria bacterium]|nr:type IV secretion system DNA-binding domain-containing protein [Candidatus Niyogibacteria bacterium]